MWSSMDSSSIWLVLAMAVAGMAAPSNRTQVTSGEYLSLLDAFSEPNTAFPNTTGEWAELSSIDIFGRDGTIGVNMKPKWWAVVAAVVIVLLIAMCCIIYYCCKTLPKAEKRKKEKDKEDGGVAMESRKKKKKDK